MLPCCCIVPGPVNTGSTTISTKFPGQGTSSASKHSTTTVSGDDNSTVPVAAPWAPQQGDVCKLVNIMNCAIVVKIVNVVNSVNIVKIVIIGNIIKWCNYS